MTLIEVSHQLPERDIAEVLGVSPITRIIRRTRHATLGEPAQVVQLHDAYYPAIMMRGTAITEDAKVIGGIYRALAAAGMVPASADHTIGVRAATPR